MLALILVFISGISTPVSEAGQSSGHYELYEIRAEIGDDRSLRVEKTMVFKNTSPTQEIRLPENILILSTLVENVEAWDDSGDLDPEIEIGSDNTRISFWTRWIQPKKSYTYHVSYAVRNAVSGIGVEYRLNYRTLIVDAIVKDTRYENYTLTVQGPPGTYPFLSIPEVDLVSLYPPIWRYSTTLEPSEGFEGFSARFYESPAFYKITLSYIFSNPRDTPTSWLSLDTILFGEGIPWQFSSIISSSIPVKTLYFDVENNLHAVFELGEIPPGGTESLSVELLYEVAVHDPQIQPDEVGNIFDIPAFLENFVQPRDKWESDHASVQQATQQALEGQTNVYLAAEKIFQYVVGHLSYENQQTRQGSLWALINRRGDCSEYTDLAIALARAAGIPARALYGWGYYENENVRGHAWLEFYFPNRGWQPADPTWAETGGDYFARLSPIHLTRMVRGLVSTESPENIFYYGSPPGSEDLKDIQNVPSSAATRLYLSAAKYHENVAAELLKGVENGELWWKLQRARNELSAAQNAGSVDETIQRAKNSISYANEIIQVLGKPPEREMREMEELFMFLVIAIIISATGAGVHAIIKRKRHFD
jgi:transglutaminase-like putative cysteine protease